MILMLSNWQACWEACWEAFWEAGVHDSVAQSLYDLTSSA